MNPESTLYNDIKNISAKELGTFIKEMIIDFINKDNKFYGLQYYYYDEEFETIDCTFPGELFKNITLLYKMKSSRFDTLCKRYENVKSSCIIFNESTSLLSQKRYKRYSTEEFLEDKFALSTVANDYELYCIEVLTFLKDINFGSTGIMIQLPWVIEYYKKYKENKYYLLDKINNPDKIND